MIWREVPWTSGGFKEYPWTLSSMKVGVTHAAGLLHLQPQQLKGIHTIFLHVTPLMLLRYGGLPWEPQ